MDELKRRFQNIIIGADQFCQVLLYGGNYTPDETISGILGRKKQAGSMNVFEKGVCWVLTKIDTDHCVKSIDTQEDVHGETL